MRRYLLMSEHRIAASRTRKKDRNCPGMDMWHRHSRKEQPKMLCSTPIGRRPIEAVPELDSAITLKILVGLF